MIRIFSFWILVAIVANLLAGLVAFVLATDRIATTTNPVAVDGIVVLTGGSGERLGYAGKLYKKNLAQRLLISGVNPQVSQQDLLALLGMSQAQLSCCVDVDVQAKNTVGNAQQISMWAKQNHYTRLLVVTSNYHMPRTLFMLRAAMPSIALIPAPARSTGAAKRHALRRTLVEYAKFLVVLFSGSSSGKT